jgi:putative phosphoesterase
MRVAALYDIHANLPALDAVLDEVRQADVDQVVIGGDVFPGPMPSETLERLLALDRPVQFIRGNGDRAVLDRMAGRESDALPAQAQEIVAWVAEQLGDEQRQILERWPQTFRVEIPGLGVVLFCHATPRSDTQIFTNLTPEARLRPIFEGLDVPLVVCGHTHMQYARTIGGVRVVNAGSVGMPFGDPGAYWLLLGPNVQLRRTPYDLTAAAERVRSTTYPQRDDFAAHSILQPKSEHEMLEAFAKVELT